MVKDSAGAKNEVTGGEETLGVELPVDVEIGGAYAESEAVGKEEEAVGKEEEAVGKEENSTSLVWKGVDEAI